MRLLSLTFLIILFVLPFSTSRAEEINAGFVEGVWYSQDHVFVDDPVRIYAALRNDTTSDLTGTVVFKDGNVTITKKEVGALAGRLIETWADWTPTYGDHTITVTLVDVKTHAIGEAPVTETASRASSENFIFVDRDTDGDKIGDKDDPDDDGDGVIDVEELENGTDPLSPNVEDPEEDESDTTSSELLEQEDEITGDVPPTSTSTQTGLEKYFEEGAVDTLLTTVTEKIATSKDSLDVYRENRNSDKEIVQIAEELNIPINATNTDNTLATITRTKIEPATTSFFATLISGIIGILNGLYTLFLWIISKLLAHPGFIQVLLLLSILIGLYKLAKRWGRRPQY